LSEVNSHQLCTVGSWHSDLESAWCYSWPVLLIETTEIWQAETNRHSLPRCFCSLWHTEQWRSVLQFNHAKFSRFVKIITTLMVVLNIVQISLIPLWYSDWNALGWTFFHFHLQPPCERLASILLSQWSSTEVLVTLLS
jgi:hypothetical protein